MRTSIKTTLMAVIGISIATLTTTPADAGRNDVRNHTRATKLVTKRAVKTASHRRQARQSHKRRQLRGLRRAIKRHAPAYGYRAKYRYQRPVYVRPIIRHRVYYGTPTYGYGTYGASNTLAGSLIGAALGGLVGSNIGKGSGRTAAIVGGVVIGGLIGGNIGNSMDQGDHVQTSYVLETAPSGKIVTWQNPDTGLEYSITPTRTYQRSSGQYCREFTTWGWIGGFEEQMHGTACRMSDGSWRNVS